MLPSEARGAWHDIEQRLRPYVARRAASAADVDDILQEIFVREAVTRTELEGLTQKGAAEMLGISVPAMKSRVQRGRDKIRDMFEDCCRISVDCRGRVTECAPRALEEIPEGCREAAASWAARRNA